MSKWLIALSTTLIAMLTAGCGTTRTRGALSDISPELKVEISASPTAIKLGDQAKLSWSSQGTSSVSINNGIGLQPPSGWVAVSPSKTSTYTATAQANGKSAQASATITINLAPTVDLQIAPNYIAKGQSAT
ncbi:MAG: hypothetical protein ACM34E_02650, partial [Acidobacteriota bacterium]